MSDYIKNDLRYIETEPIIKSGLYVIKPPSRSARRILYYDAITKCYFNDNGIDVSSSINPKSTYKEATYDQAIAYVDALCNKIDRATSLLIMADSKAREIHKYEKLETSPSTENTYRDPPETRCQGCYYWKNLCYSSAGVLKCCHYMLYTGNLRGCPPNHCDKKFCPSIEEKEELDKKYITTQKYFTIG